MTRPWRDPAVRHTGRWRAFKFADIVIILGVLAFAGFMGRPWFAKYQQNRDRSNCQTNMKVVARAIISYAMDYGDVFPASNVPSRPLTLGQIRLTNWAAHIYPYVKDAQLFQCPSEPASKGTDYYYSKAFAGIEGFNCCSANMVLMTEGPDTANAALATATAPVRTGTSPPFRRHLDGSNYAFNDGHVKWLQSSRAAANSGVAGSGGGFSFGT